MEFTMETMLSLMVGLGLSAACGFRVFVPPLVISIAALSGHLQLASGFEWLGTYPALITFSVALMIELLAYYVPVVDNFLDSVATPAAIVAGTVITASMVADVSPFLKWTLAVVAGGGVAGAVQGATVVLRGASTLGTGGLGNPLLATVEAGGAVTASVLSLVVPGLVLVVVIGLIAFSLKKFYFDRRQQVVAG